MSSVDKLNALRITCGTIRALTREEKKQWESQGYCWVVVTPYTYECGDKKITVPAEFLTDGSSGGGPDYGCSWLFHDWLYANHCFDLNEDPIEADDASANCTREEADEVMSTVLTNERLSIYLSVFNCLSGFNICYCFSRAWESSGKRGPQYLKNAVPD